MSLLGKLSRLNVYMFWIFRLSRVSQPHTTRSAAQSCHLATARSSWSQTADTLQLAVSPPRPAGSTRMSLPLLRPRDRLRLSSTGITSRRRRPSATRPLPTSPRRPLPSTLNLPSSVIEQFYSVPKHLDQNKFDSGIIWCFLFATYCGCRRGVERTC